MKISTIENCRNLYTSFGDWEPRLDIERDTSLESFPYSIVVEGSSSEIDIALHWCVVHIGEADATTEIPEYRIYADDSSYTVIKTGVIESGGWKVVFYGKIAYNYGYFEFFFKKHYAQKDFEELVPEFYGVGLNGKWKTNGPDSITDIL